MPEQCGCRTVEAFRTSAGFATDAEIIYCNLHARAAEMRELLMRLTKLERTVEEGIKLAIDIQAVLEQTR